MLTRDSVRSWIGAQSTCVHSQADSRNEKESFHHLTETKPFKNFCSCRNVRYLPPTYFPQVQDKDRAIHDLFTPKFFPLLPATWNPSGFLPSVLCAVRTYSQYSVGSCWLSARQLGEVSVVNRSLYLRRTLPDRTRDKEEEEGERRALRTRRHSLLRSPPPFLVHHLLLCPPTTYPSCNGSMSNAMGVQ